MLSSPKTIRIVVALLISLSFIGAGYYFSSPLRTGIANATSTEELLKAYATKDADSDGLPDWQESLYATDPNNAHSVDSALTDKQAVDQGLVEPRFKSATSTPVSAADIDFSITPAKKGSFTEQFSRAFMQSYLSATSERGMLGPEDQQALVNDLLAQFSAKSQTLVASSYTDSSVKTSSTITVLAYTEALHEVLAANELNAEDGTLLSISEDFFQKGDLAARAKLVNISTAFSAIAKGFAALTVPEKVRTDHLNLIQSFDTLSKIAKIASTYEEDPVAALGAYSAYLPAAQQMQNVWLELSPKILEEGEPAEGSPAATVVNFARNAQKP